MPPTCCRSNPEIADSDPARGSWSDWTRLAAGLLAIVVVWIAALPRLADQPPVRRHIEFLQQRQIDPSAMFYTELEPMGEVRTRVERIRHDHPAQFWQPQLSQDRSGVRP